MISVSRVIIRRSIIIFLGSFRPWRLTIVIAIVAIVSIFLIGNWRGVRWHSSFSIIVDRLITCCSRNGRSGRQFTDSSGKIHCDGAS